MYKIEFIGTEKLENNAGYKWSISVKGTEKEYTFRKASKEEIKFMEDRLIEELYIWQRMHENHKFTTPEINAENICKLVNKIAWITENYAKDI